VRVLLRQPGGFEGLGLLMVEIELQPRREAIVVQGPHGPAVVFDLDAAPRSSPRGVVAHQDLVPLDAELKCLELLLLEGVWLHPCAQRVSASKRRLARGAHEFNLGMGDLRRRIEVVAIERLVKAPQSGDDLLVSVGQRPLSIPRCQGTAQRAERWLAETRARGEGASNLWDVYRELTLAWPGRPCPQDQSPVLAMH
jgi:hypothetical protein